MLFVILTVVPYSTDNVIAQAEIVIVSSYTSKDRVTPGEIIGVGFRLEWASSGDPVSTATIRINGKTYSGALQDGWIIIQRTYDYVGNYIWSIESIIVDGGYRSFEMATGKPSCIFDKVVIVVDASYNRIGLGQTPDIYYNAYYASDGQSFSGNIYLNDSVTSDVVGAAKIGVTRIEDDLYGISHFDTNTVTIIWDRVDVILFSSDLRYDLNKEPKLTYIANYQYDLTTFMGTVNFDYQLFNTVGKHEVTVSSIRDNLYNLRSFKSNTIEVIIDQVFVELKIDEPRINMGDKVQASWDAYYIYDYTAFDGRVTIGPSERMSSVGSKKITVTEITDSKFGLSSFISNEVEVVWDRIRVDLSTQDERVNVGDIVDVSVDAYYEYDGEKIDVPDVHLNDVSKRLNTVGEFIFKVESVESKYGINKVFSNDVTVIWDNIQFEIDAPKERTILGSIDAPIVTAYYGYSGNPFYGTYGLNRDFGTEIGPAEYYVTKMSDEAHGITAFTTNRAEYYFDQIKVQSSISQGFPGIYKTTFEVTYVSDGSPVNNVDVIVDGEQSSYMGNGVYQAETGSIFPYVQSHGSVIVDGYTIENVVLSSIMIGNIVAIIVVLGGGSVAINKYVTSDARKAKKIRELRKRDEFKQLVINEINQKWGMISLNELSLNEIKLSLRTELIKEALNDGYLTGRLMKNDTIFVHQGFESELIRKKLSEL